MSRFLTLISGTALALTLGASSVQAGDPDLTVFDWSGFEIQALIEPYVAKYGQMPTYALFGDIGLDQGLDLEAGPVEHRQIGEIGRASCRERV